jgi:predicted outer membrane protein
MENGLVQLYLGELAREKAEAEQVKKVADLLSATQEEENKRLMRLASMKGINLSVAQSSAKKTVDARLGKLSGPKFDKTLLEELVAANQRAVATYEAATSTQDQEIRSYAEQGLPLAKEKLLIANKMTGNPMRTHRAPAPEPAAAGTPASSSGSRP